MKYIRRAVEDLVLRTDGTFKAVLLTGARQTGKTEMITRLFPGREYVRWTIRSSRSRPARIPACS